MPPRATAQENMFSIRHRARSQYSSPTPVAVVSLVNTCSTGASCSNKVSWRAGPYPLICTVSSASITCTCSPPGDGPLGRGGGRGGQWGPPVADPVRSCVPAGGEHARVGPAPVAVGDDRGGSYPCVFTTCRDAGADWVSYRRRAGAGDARRRDRAD